MLKKRVMVAGFVLLVLSLNAQAASLHFLVFADTLESDIGTVDDLNNAQTWGQTIATNTGLTLNFQSVSGTDLTIANARAALTNLSVNSDDVVYFFYTGHGGNPGSATWPTLYFSQSGDYENHLTADEVRQTLSAKSPRLLLVMADCCNNYAWQSGRVTPFLPRAASAQAIANYKRLFVDYSGSLIASGCSPGEFSLGAEGEGGLWTNSLINAFQTLAESETTLTWEAVFSKAKQDASAEAALSGSTQTPQYELTASATPTNPDTGTDTGSDQDGTGGMLPDSGDEEWDTGTDEPYDYSEEVLSSTPVAGGAECGAPGLAMLSMTFIGMLGLSASTRRR